MVRGAQVVAGREELVRGGALERTALAGVYPVWSLRLVTEPPPRMRTGIYPVWPLRLVPAPGIYPFDPCDWWGGDPSRSGDHSGCSAARQASMRTRQVGLHLIGPPWEYTCASCVRLARRGNIPALSASDWSAVGTYPRRRRGRVFCRALRGR
eukprot:236291-Pyramimonas_sp.AAC.1